MALTMSTRSVEGRAASSDTSGLTGFDTLPYELRAEIIKQYVWQELPSDESDERTPILNQYARSLWTLQLLFSYDIVEHFKTAVQGRLKHEGELLKHLKILDDELDNFYGCLSPTHDATAKLCRCFDCVEGPILFGMDQFRESIAKGLPNWTEEFGRDWDLEQVRIAEVASFEIPEATIFPYTFCQSAATRLQARKRYRCSVLKVLSEHVPILQELCVSFPSVACTLSDEEPLEHIAYGAGA